MFKQQKTSDSEAKITVVCRESLSAGVPGKLCCTLSNSSLVQLVTSGRISGLFMFHLPLHEAFWLLLIKALKSTFPIIISISESTTRFTTSINLSLLDKMMKIFHLFWHDRDNYLSRFVLDSDLTPT